MKHLLLMALLRCSGSAALQRLCCVATARLDALSSSQAGAELCVIAGNLYTVTLKKKLHSRVQDLRKRHKLQAAHPALVLALLEARAALSRDEGTATRLAIEKCNEAMKDAGAGSIGPEVTAEIDLMEEVVQGDRAGLQVEDDIPYDEWVNVGENNYAAHAQRWVRVWSMVGAIQALDGESPHRLATGMWLVYQKLGITLTADDQDDDDSRHFPSMKMAAAFLRAEKHNAARAVKRYYAHRHANHEFMKERENSLAHASVDQLQPRHMTEMDMRGLRLLRDDSGALVHSQSGGPVIVVQADRFYHKDDDSVSDTLWLLFAFTSVVVAQAPYASFRWVTLYPRRVWGYYCFALSISWATLSYERPFGS